MHEVLVNRLGGLSLPRKSVVRLPDRPDMTLDVYRGRKTTIRQQHKMRMDKSLCQERLKSKTRDNYSIFTLTGTDEYGEHVHSCMYYDLWTNSPKEIIEYPDYTFEKHFGGPVPSYLPWDVVRNYIGGKLETLIILSRK